MNRYQTLAIFVILIIIVFGSVNSYFLAKAKEQLAKQTQTEQPAPKRSQQPIRQDANYFEDDEVEEDEEADFIPKRKQPQTPIVVEETPQINNPKVPQARPTRYYNFDEETITQKESKKNNTAKVSIPCQEPYKSEGICDDETQLVADRKDSVSKIFLSASNGETDLKTHLEADITGSKMTVALAEKICTDKGMRLPETLELALMFNVAKPQFGEEFFDDYYWAVSYYADTGVYCLAGTDECNSPEDDDPNSVQLHRVRCVQ